ncbi:MAG: hypothetical protein AAGJ52_01815 [Pseudomonadota bacterium]
MKRFLSAFLLLIPICLLAQEAVEPEFLGVTPFFPAEGHFIEAGFDTGVPACGNELVPQTGVVQGNDVFIDFEVISTTETACEIGEPLILSVPLGQLLLGQYDLLVQGTYDGAAVPPREFSFLVFGLPTPAVDRISPENPTVGQIVSTEVLTGYEGCNYSIQSQAVAVTGTQVLIEFDVIPDVSDGCGVPPSLAFDAEFMVRVPGDYEVQLNGRYQGLALPAASFAFGVIGRPSPVPIGTALPLLLPASLLLIGILTMRRFGTGA